MSILGGYSVSHLSGGALEITSGGSLLFSFPFWLGLAGTAYFVYRVLRTRNAWPLLGLAIWSVPLLLTAYLGNRGPSVLLDRGAKEARITQPHGLWHSTRSLPLQEIRRAQLRTAGTYSWMALVETDGAETTFPTNQPGADEATRAINTYLASPTP